MDCRPLSPNLELWLVFLRKSKMKENTTTISLFLCLVAVGYTLLRHLIKGGAARQQMNRHCF
jgi:hypothetical protein